MSFPIYDQGRKRESGGKDLADVNTYGCIIRCVANEGWIAVKGFSGRRDVFDFYEGFLEVAKEQGFNFKRLEVLLSEDDLIVRDKESGPVIKRADGVYYANGKDWKGREVVRK